MKKKGNAQRLIRNKSIINLSSLGFKPANILKKLFMDKINCSIDIIYKVISQNKELILQNKLSNITG